MNLNRWLSLIVIAIYVVLLALNSPSVQRKTLPPAQAIAENQSPGQIHPLPQEPFYQPDSLPLRLVRLGFIVLIPLFCIWFPEVAGVIRSSHGRRQNHQFEFDPNGENQIHDERYTTLFTLIGGWFFFVGAPILYFLLSLNVSVSSISP